MRGRVETCCVGRPSPAPRPNLGTFHAICARILRREAERLPVSRLRHLRRHRPAGAGAPGAQGAQPGRQAGPARLLCTPPSRRPRTSCIRPEEYPREHATATRSPSGSTGAIRQLLRENNALDFDDLLCCAVRLFRDRTPRCATRYRRRYQHLLVDEFQDTNTAQYELCCASSAGEAARPLRGRRRGPVHLPLARARTTATCCASQKDYPEAAVFLLEQNYRSTQTILDAAMAVIDRHPRPHAQAALHRPRPRARRCSFSRGLRRRTTRRAYVVETIAELMLARRGASRATSP